MRHFHEELEQLRQKLVNMAFAVEGSVEKAVDATLQYKKTPLLEVLGSEKEINQFEIDIDDIGHTLLALDQPMAVDLRLVTAILKMNTTLERIGDHAVNIAQRGLNLIELRHLDGLMHHLDLMARTTLLMLSASLDAFRRQDAAAARDVFAKDDLVDRAKNTLFIEVEKAVAQDVNHTRAAINILMIGCNLERIADLACNVCEDVVYAKQGKEVRHRVELSS